MGNSQSTPDSTQRQHSTGHSMARTAPIPASLPASSVPASVSEHNRWHLEPVAPESTPQPCRCQWCLDYAVPDSPYQTPSTPLEEFLEFRRQVLSRVERKYGAGADEDDKTASRSPAGAKMSGFKRRFSRSKTNFSRRLSLSSKFASTHDLTANGDRDNAVIQDSGSPVGLGLVEDDPLSPQNPPSGQPRLVSARRRSFNIPGVPTRFPLFNRSRHVARRSDSFFHYKSDTSEPLRRSWTDAGAVHNHTRPRTASPTRAISPFEQGYTHLGRFKFGSLHVVNGCASPAPSSKKQRSSCPDLKSMAQSTETLHDGDSGSEAGISTAEGHPESSSFPSSPPPPIPLRSSSRLNGRLDMAPNSEDAARQTPVEDQRPAKKSVSDPRLKLMPLTTTRRPSMSWFDDSPTSPPFVSSPDSVHLRPFTPLSIQPTPVLVTTTKANEYDDNLFEDEGMEIPVYWDDTVQSHESFHDTQFHGTLSKERQEAKQWSTSGRSGTLNKTDSGYSSASGKSTSRYRHSSGQKKSSRDRNGRMFEGDSQGLAHCNGSITDPVEGTISITSHGSKEIINAVFPWPPAHLRYPVEPYASQAQKQKPEHQSPSRYEPNADTMSEYNLDPTYPVRVRYEPSRPPPIPPQYRPAKKSSHSRPSNSQHTQYKGPTTKSSMTRCSPIKGLAIKCPDTKDHTSKRQATKSHPQSHPQSHPPKRSSRRHRDSTPARMTGEKPRSASQLHARSASDLTSSRRSRRVNTDKPLPALPPSKDFQFPRPQMPTPPLSRSTSLGDLKLLTDTGPNDLINYITNHTPVEIDNNMWGSLSADPELDLELLPLNLDLNKSALHDYQPISLQESINQTRRQQKLHRSASHFSFDSSINQRPGGRYSPFPPSPINDVFGDNHRKSRRPNYQSGPPPTTYRISQSKTTATEKRSSRPPKPSSSCAAQVGRTHQKPGALNHIESYI
ncbi:uncharacterized protein GIQ15_04468 [Arthroderma uncinatum]|uniref:uncharacterized protein n=1 Tax=Arthroderma uncinatum TaxID=74035 RepID=UPI00144ADBE7|nr:uncharacterized protein GIQ15_04468 [Arthroderma uncinatum]KAF3481709.1 hypothetical protein GIQ15_04468 [Arthroderma uncinatum]